MTVASDHEIDVRDLKSVRKAASARQDSDVVLGDDWVSPDVTVTSDVRKARAKRGLIMLNRSPLARKIITFNLLAIIILVAGVLYLNPSRDNLAFQRADGLVSEAELVADVFEAQLPLGAPVNLMAGDGIDPVYTLDGLDLRGGVDVYVFDSSGVLVASRTARVGSNQVIGLDFDDEGTFLTGLLNRAWDAIAGIFRPTNDELTPIDPLLKLNRTLPETLAQGTRVDSEIDSNGRTIFLVSTPILQGDRPVGVVSMISAAGELDALVRREREQVLQMFVIGIIVSIGLSLVLASTIANPLAELATAAELGRDKNARKMSPTRIRIPDLTARPDEIGRLSGALRGMVSALYERIEGNEQFAADVAHEIKNPLASLRSAVGSLRMVKKEEHKEKLLEVIEHDVQRLDRLVSDISNASRLDSELVREEEEEFNLLKMLGNLNEFLGKEANAKGIEYITDLPTEPIRISGLEGRLAQVFVNLITNAISFCEEGDAIRVWARRRDNRVLVVVEDTGPGIPDGALTKIFKRFYSERPEQQFGNNSGLGLAISKQIVEAHNGVIWAENIRPTEADITSEPLGARFVVGLPI
ncbi:HAMP domain-containing protein [Loktanella sp. IMCC34160]|uniref:sensor N-terminal transmembrane domain-containing protein n=1 Tax=Loktanella sp. IMCC34160 TaxID=2510646 RepID=UPI00101CA88B|nr:sensor N-terminal transmembrane domain-containing protein [Loktanella sp. IMCC34160]RYG91601.1 HAMP domain-containing protein [Loktanella sp. IMCC34160]